MSEFFQEHAWVLPLLIFASRVTDVSIGTMRIVFLSRGMRILAPICGFFEIFIWLLAIGQIMQNLDSWMNHFAYAGGFATGNYIGLRIEGRLAVGLVSLWIITAKDATQLIKRLKDHHHGVTVVAAQGVQGLVHIVIMVVKRKNLPTIMAILHECNPNAFVTMNDVRSVSGGFFDKHGAASGVYQTLPRGRKGK